MVGSVESIVSMRAQKYYRVGHFSLPDKGGRDVLLSTEIPITGRVEWEIGSVAVANTIAICHRTQIPPGPS